MSSSINPFFTFEYFQPSEYRFSHDSVFLARRAFEFLTHPNNASGNSIIPHMHALDLCSGCGIIGLDFIYHCQKEKGFTPLVFDFMEVQEVYHSHFLKNVEQLKIAGDQGLKNIISTKFNFLNKNYNELQNSEFAGKYDLILCNPPYFFPERGTLSPVQFKNRCRFFIDSDFKNLLLGISASLNAQGIAFILLRDLSNQGWNSVVEAKRVLGTNIQLQIIGQIRGTHFVKLQRFEFC